MTIQSELNKGTSTIIKLPMEWSEVKYMKIKVILVDGHQLILNGLAKTLNDDPDIIK